MRMFQVCRCGEPLQLNEKPTPQPAGTEVLLKVQAAGVCHSDLHIWDGYYDIGGGQKLRLQDRGVKLPLTMGHENVGEVVARVKFSFCQVEQMIVSVVHLSSPLVVALIGAL